MIIIWLSSMMLWEHLVLTTSCVSRTCGPTVHTSCVRLLVRNMWQMIDNTSNETKPLSAKNEISIGCINQFTYYMQLSRLSDYLHLHINGCGPTCGYQTSVSYSILAKIYIWGWFSSLMNHCIQVSKDIRDKQKIFTFELPYLTFLVDNDTFCFDLFNRLDLFIDSKWIGKLFKHFTIIAKSVQQNVKQQPCNKSQCQKGDD